MANKNTVTLEQIGLDICKEKVMNKLWELEGYKLQCELGKL